LLILIGLVPATYAVDLGTGQASLQEIVETTQSISFQNGPPLARRRDGLAAKLPPMSCRTTSRRPARLPTGRFPAIGNQVPRNLREAYRQDRPAAGQQRGSPDAPDRPLPSFPKRSEKLNKQHLLKDPAEQKVRPRSQEEAGQSYEVHPHLGQGCGGFGARPRHDDRLEADRRKRSARRSARST